MYILETTDSATSDAPDGDGKVDTAERPSAQTWQDFFVSEEVIACRRVCCVTQQEGLMCDTYANACIRMHIYIYIFNRSAH